MKTQKSSFKIADTRVRISVSRALPARGSVRRAPSPDVSALIAAMPVNGSIILPDVAAAEAVTSAAYYMRRRGTIGSTVKFARRQMPNGTVGVFRTN